MTKKKAKTLEITIAFLAVWASLGHAEMTVCKVKNIHAGINIAGIKGLAWDDQSKEAQVTDFSGKQFAAKVTLISEGLGKQERVNIFVQYPKEYLGYNASEYVVYSTGPGEHRVTGVSYIHKNGKFHLRSLMGSDEARCFSAGQQ